MKFQKVLFRKFKLPIFGATVWIIISNTLESGIEYARDRTSEIILKDEEIKHTAAYTYAYIDENGVKRYMLFFTKKSTPGEIAHESKHLVNILFSWHGYKLSLTNDEMECYYLGAIVDKIHRAISDYRKKYPLIKRVK